MLAGVVLGQFGGTIQVPLKATELYRWTAMTRWKRYMVSCESPVTLVNLHSAAQLR